MPGLASSEGAQVLTECEGLIMLGGSHLTSQADYREAWCEIKDAKESKTKEERNAMCQRIRQQQHAETLMS